MKEIRRKPRTEVKERVRLHWRDAQGHLRNTRADALDVSLTGLRLRTEIAIEPHTLVSIEARELKIAGVAMVRRCVRSSINHYTVGLQFAGGLEWRGAASSPA